MFPATLVLVPLHLKGKTQCCKLAGKIKKSLKKGFAICAHACTILSLFMVAIAQLVEHRIVIPAVAGSSPVSHPTFFMVAIAQLVEHRIVIPAVVGSSPISHPIKKPSKNYPL